MTMKTTTVTLEDTDKIRSSQLVLLYGSGALVPLPERVVMTGAPELWKSIKPIHDPRLEKALGVDHFGLPRAEESRKGKRLDRDGGQPGVVDVSFPEWYFCPKCHTFRKLSDWMEEAKQHAGTGKSDTVAMDFMRAPFCPDCGPKQPLVVARLVTVCQHGHIDDFPWFWWAHQHQKEGEKCNREHPKLKITTRGSNQGFAGITIECVHCGAKETLQSVLGAQALKEKGCKCRGRHPWRMYGEYEKGGCTADVRAVLRGASSIYYPFICTSLVLPESGSELQKYVEASETFNSKYQTWHDEEELSGEALVEKLQKGAGRIADEIGADRSDVEDAIKEIIERMEGRSDEERVPYNSPRYREQEYQALLDEETEPTADFERETSPDAYPALPFLQKVVLVHKLREVRVQTGFSRLVPVASSEEEGFVSIKRSETNWYPGYDVRGEGIFLVFEDEAIKAWVSHHPEAGERAARLSKNYQEHSNFAQKHPRIITAKFLLLHSLAHLLIRELSFECGYSIASLRERIYCDDGGAESEAMSGILIYTANGDSEGTLGGLVRQGYGDTLPKIFARAIDHARFCSNDPVCSLSKGQGRDGLNLAACHACMLLPETSCEEFNSFLDRGVIIGTMEQPDMGFFSGDGTVWTSEKNALDSPARREAAASVLQAEPEKAANLRTISSGTEINDYTAAEVWERLARKCDNFGDEAGRAKMEEFSRAWDVPEASLPQGAFGMEFRDPATGETFKADLAFPKQHVLIFIVRDLSEKQYVLAQRTGWHCYLTNQMPSCKEMRAKLEV
ncbi:DrmB family protein [uncultured Selenomonas sp.]|uniref:DrmB family protein n=1 Tax=uncultured Selenomonas sp. TaxID=159275 RepID=UPI0025E257AB|nr:DrmB family protein [uncultured Selenomonas sp.]